MRNACDSDSRCGLACDASTRDAKSLAMRVERCEPLRSERFASLLQRRYIMLGQKSCRTKIPRIFGIVVPNFAPIFRTKFPPPPQFLRTFHALFPGRQRPLKIHQKSCRFSMPNPQADSKKKSTKVFWESRQSHLCKATEVKEQKCTEVFVLNSKYPDIRFFLMVPPRGFLFLRFCGDCALKCENWCVFCMEDCTLQSNICSAN